MIRRRTRILVLLMGLILLTSVAGVVIAEDEVQSVRGEPDIAVYTPEPTLTPGSTTELTVQLENDGRIRWGASAQRELVTTARAVNVELREEGPIVVETERQSVGSIADGERLEVPIAVTVPEDAEPGEYELDLRVRYSHTFQFAPRSGVVQERSRSITRSVDVTVDDGPRFEIDAIDSDVQIGDTGTVQTEVRNVGGETARDLTVELESSSADVTLGEGPANTARIDRLEPGENATLPYDVTVRPDVSHRNLSLVGDVHFTDTDGVQSSQDGLSTGFEPAPDQEFSISVDESTLRVGESGTVRGTIRNDGPSNVTDVVVVLGEAQFEPRSPSYAIGELERGESATFRFRGAVPFEADSVPQRFDVETRYRTPADNERTTEGSMYAPVDERRDALTFSAVGSQFTAGEDGVLELEVTNQRDVELRDVRLRLEVEDPLESEFRSTVIESLEPGETDRIAFDLEVDSDAPASRYPATIEAEYTDPDDERLTIRPATVAVTVTADDGVDLVSPELLVFVILLVLVGVVLVWLYRR